VDCPATLRAPSLIGHGKSRNREVSGRVFDDEHAEHGSRGRIGRLPSPRFANTFCAGLPVGKSLGLPCARPDKWLNPRDWANYLHFGPPRLTSTDRVDFGSEAGTPR
jgi:hypothetical protein